MAREKGMGNLQREKSGRWTMRVSIKGKRYCRSTRTTDREQAERYLQRFLGPFGLGERRLPLADVWLEYVKSPLRNDLAPSTLKAKQLVWMHFARWMERFYLCVGDLAGVTAEMVAEYLACLRADLCATSYNSRVCILRGIFYTLANKAGLVDDPWEGVKLRPDDSHSRRELTTDELRRLLEAAKKVKVEGEGEQRNLSSCSSLTSGQETASPFNEWYRLILIGIYTGLRLGDCCRLDWSQIKLAQGVIQVMPQKTKRHHQRIVTIPIHQRLGAELLASQVKVGGEGGSKSKSEVEVEQRNLSSCSAGQPEQKIDYHCTPTPPTYTSFSGPVLPMISEMYVHSRWRLSKGLERIFARANIAMNVRLEGRKHRAPEATFHSLRHTFVSLAANAGVPLHVVQSIVGHESTAMTRHYYHENVDALRRAVSAIPSFDMV